MPLGDVQLPGTSLNAETWTVRFIRGEFEVRGIAQMGKDWQIAEYALRVIGIANFRSQRLYGLALAGWSGRNG